MMIVCGLCGFRYDPAHSQVCQSCPLHNGCNLTRCPACGFEQIATRDHADRPAAVTAFTRSAWQRLTKRTVVDKVEDNHAFGLRESNPKSEITQ